MHTPGPWFVGARERAIVTGSREGRVLLRPAENTLMSDDDMRLIAAAPDLLAALQLIAGTDPIDAALDPQRAVRVAKEALRKATGEQT